MQKLIAELLELIEAQGIMLISYRTGCTRGLPEKYWSVLDQREAIIARAQAVVDELALQELEGDLV